MRCEKCGNESVSGATYCKECGNQVQGEKVDYNDENKKYYIQTLLLFLIIVLIITSSIVINLPFFKSELLFSGLIIFTTIVFALLDYKGFFGIFKFKFHLKAILQVFFGAPLFALLVLFLARFLNTVLGIESESYYNSYLLYTPNMYVYGILFVSIIPGFFEEFLFRGILFNHLLKLTTPKSTIIITSVLFAFIHFSFLSFWLFIIGFYLGYLRYRYQSILYCILFHTLYNASIFFFEMIL